MARVFIALCFLLLLVTPSVRSACTRSISIPGDCGILNLGCNLNTLLSALLCWGQPLALTLTVTSGSYSLSLTSTNLYSLSVTTTGSGVILLNVNADLSILNNLVISGLGVLLVPVGTLVNVLGNLIVNTGATLRVAGNVSVSGSSTVYGTLQLNGTRVYGPAQTAWVTSSLITIGNPSPSTPGTLRGNGGIRGDVTCGSNAVVSAGNSPGVIYVDGNLVLSSTTNMIIDVDNGASFDAYAVTRLFGRGSGRATLNFAPGYVPNSSDRFIFVTHANASGYFSTVTGNLQNLLGTFGSQSTSVIYDDASVPSYCSSVCTPMSQEADDKKRKWLV